MTETVLWEELELTQAQNRICMDEMIHPGTSIYNIGGCVHFSGVIDFELFDKAIQETIKKYDAVRIQLKNGSLGIRQYMPPYEFHKTEIVDFNGTKSGGYRGWCLEEMTKPVFGYHQPLYRFKLLKINENETGFFLMFHHAIADGWSVNIVLDSIYQYYLSFKYNQPVEDEEIRSYGETVREELMYLSSEKFEKQKEYWNAKYSRLPEQMIKTSSDPSGNRLEIELGQITGKMVSRYIKTANISQTEMCIAQMAILLYQFYGQEDIIIGIPLYNRRKQTKKVFGLFVSNVLVRLQLDGKMTVRDVYRQVKGELRQCYKNKDYPYNLLMKDLGVRKKGLHNLYQISVNNYNTSLYNQLDGIAIRNEELYGGQQLYPFQLTMKDWSGNQNISIFLDYQTDVLSEKTSQALLDCYQKLLMECMKDDCRKLMDLPFLPEKLEMELIFSYNKGHVRSVEFSSVLDMFQEQVRKDGSKIAAAQKTESLTFKEMDYLSDQIAGLVKAKTKSSTGYVAVISEHSIMLIAAFLGIMKAGRAFLPIDPEYPEERIRFMLEDAGADMVMTDTHNRSKVERCYSGSVAELEKSSFSDQDLCPLPFRQQIKPEDPAYVIYTSGSTGKPKGVVINHRGLANYICHCVDTYMENGADVWAFFSSISFDLTITSVFTPLAGGGSIQIYPRSKKAQSLIEIIEDNQVSGIKLTPSHIKLLNSITFKDTRIKTVIVGGETFPSALAEILRKNGNNDIRIFNEYGPTEATVGCMVYEYKNDLQPAVPIGEPIRNTSLYVLNQNLKPVPYGIVGELYISGDCLSDGYLNQEELNNQVFLPNPFEPGGNMYKTGDFVRFLDDGSLDYVGRKDGYKKVNGYRLETEEIENVLMKCDSVTKAAVIVHEQNLQQQIIAFVDCMEVELSKVQSQARQYLPAYMMPQTFLAVTEIPLTINGKTDHRKLQKIYEQNQEALENKSNITDGNCQITAGLEVFQIILDKPELKAEDNYFSMDGDSIKAIQISGELRKKGFLLNPDTILLNPVIQEALSAMERVEGKKEAEDYRGIIKKTPVIKAFFENCPNYNDYCQSVLLELNNWISFEVLEEILKRIYAHYDIFRLRYHPKNGELSYEESGEICVEEIGISEMSENNVDRMIERVSRRMKKELSLTEGKLLAACLFTQKARKQRLMIAIHHLCVDAVSWHILMSDFKQLIEDIRNGISRDLIRTDPYALWAKGAAETVSSDVRWIGYKKREGKYLYGNRAERKFVLAKEQLKDLKRVAAQEYYVNLDEFLLITLGLVLNDRTSDKQVGIVCEGHGRKSPGHEIRVERTLGWFTELHCRCITKTMGAAGERFMAVKKIICHDSCKTLNMKSDILFNFLGDFDSSFQNEMFSFIEGDTGLDQDPSNCTEYLMEVQAFILRGELHVKILFDQTVFEQAEMDLIASEFKENIMLFVYNEKCSESQYLAASDFNCVDLGDDDLEMLLG